MEPSVVKLTAAGGVAKLPESEATVTATGFDDAIWPSALTAFATNE